MKSPADHSQMNTFNAFQFSILKDSVYLSKYRCIDIKHMPRHFVPSKREIDFFPDNGHDYKSSPIVLCESVSHAVVSDSLWPHGL